MGYAGTDPHFSAFAVQPNGADGDVEDGCPIRGEITDGTGIHATPVFFQLVDDLHGSDLRCPGDGAAGEESPEQLGELKLFHGRRPRFSLDCRRHLQEALVGLDIKK